MVTLTDATEHESLTFAVELTPAYSAGGDDIVINGVDIVVTLPVIPGLNKVQTPFVNVGHSGSGLSAAISITYTFEPLDKVFVFCGNDLVAAESNYLVLRSDKTGQAYHQHTYPGEEVTYDDSLDWLCRPSIRPELIHALRLSIRGAVQSVFDTVVKLGYNVLVRTPPPEGEEDFKLIYQNGAYKGLWHPEYICGTDEILVGLGSVWGGEIYLNQWENFANVIGSTGDPRIAGLSWLRLWQNQFGIATICSSFQYDDFPCTQTLYGGHVILGQAALPVPYGVNYVFIMPICASHNNNDNVDMAPVVYNMGIALNNYHGH